MRPRQTNTHPILPALLKFLPSFLLPELNSSYVRARVCACLNTKHLHKQRLPIQFAYLEARLLARSAYGSARSCNRTGFPWFAFVIVRTLSWHTHSRYTACFSRGPPHRNSIFSPKRILPNVTTVSRYAT